MAIAHLSPGSSLAPANPPGTAADDSPRLGTCTHIDEDGIPGLDPAQPWLLPLSQERVETCLLQPSEHQQVAPSQVITVVRAS